MIVKTHQLWRARDFRVLVLWTWFKVQNEAAMPYFSKIKNLRPVEISGTHYSESQKREFLPHFRPYSRIFGRNFWGVAGINFWRKHFSDINRKYIFPAHFDSWLYLTKSWPYHEKSGILPDVKYLEYNIQVHYYFYLLLKSKGVGFVSNME